jgi:manganese efflux pump family protein
MTLIELLGVAFALGCDAFSVAVGVGGCWRDAHSRFRLSFHFGLFQFLMPLIGWRVGQQIIPLIRGWDHWFVFAVLMIVAGKMLYESFKTERDEKAQRTCNPTRGWMLVGLALATSVDALGVGLTFGSLYSRQIAYAGVIGIVAASMTLAGMLLAGSAVARWGAWGERLGALLLGIVAVKLLLTV